MMINTTLCYIERDGCYLLLHRTKKSTTSIKTSGSASAENLRKERARRNVSSEK